ncbi:MAG: thiamine diphosphokinase [Clostridia bacterium]|nr:thiamine diphosphokinase [Clostridia bacterium]
MKKCFIFGALYPKEMFVKPTNEDFIIAADNGFAVLQKLNITPNLVVGDFDSLGYEPEVDKKIVLPVKKDDTDLSIALKTALDKGYSDIFVYGAAGGKLDHTFANITLAAETSRKGVNCVFLGDNTNFTALTNGKLCFNGAGGRVSVFAFGGNAVGVTLKGVEYELDNATLEAFVPLGVSNAFCGTDAEISVKSGTLIVMWEDKTLPRR